MIAGDRDRLIHANMNLNAMSVHVSTVSACTVSISFNSAVTRHGGPFETPKSRRNVTVVTAIIVRCRNHLVIYRNFSKVWTCHGKFGRYIAGTKISAGPSRVTGPASACTVADKDQVCFFYLSSRFQSYFWEFWNHFLSYSTGVTKLLFFA